MKILITGNCGFIGQNFVRMFKDEHEIIGIDKMSYASDKNAAKLCPTWRLDLSCDDLNPVFNHTKYDVVIHAAASSHVDNSITSPEEFIYDNYIGTFRLLEMIKKYEINNFCLLSTDEIYGDLQKDDLPFSDYCQIKPSSPYSASKAAADMLVLAYHRTYGMNTVTIRACNNYGPYQFKEKFIPVIILNILNNKQIPIYGSGFNQREWIFVNDCCHGIMNVIKNGKSGEVYNIGSNMECSNINLVKQILTIMNKPESLISFVEDRKGHDLRYAMDSTKARDLGWEVTTHLQNGLIKTIEWFRNNPKYWE